MRKLYNEFFYIPKCGKIREKVMLARNALTIAIVVMCLAAMSITAYAYFSYNVTSGSNTIKAASFYVDVEVQITGDDETTVEDSNITPIISDNKNFVVSGLEVGKWYKFTVTKSEKSTAQTGFVVVSAEGSPVIYHTQQLGVDKSVSGEYTSAITFKMMITDETDVILVAHWGTSSYYSEYQIDNVDDEQPIILDDEIKMIVNEYTEPNISKEEENISETDLMDEISTSLTEPTETSELEDSTDETMTTPTTDIITDLESSDMTSIVTEPIETSEPEEQITSTVTEPTVTESKDTELTEPIEPQLVEEKTSVTTTEANE